MARVLVAAQTPPGAYPSFPISANSLDMDFQASDNSLGNYTPLVDNKTYVLAWNTDTGAHTITFTSAADTFNRTGDITSYSIGAGEIAQFGPFRTAGWSQSGQLWIDTTDVTIELAVITLP